MSRDGYFFEGLNILIITFCVVFKVFQKLFTTLYNYKLFYLLTETLLRIPFYVIGRSFPSADH
jgi:hypothetical protein